MTTKIAILLRFPSESVPGACSSLVRLQNRSSPLSRHGDNLAAAETLRRSFGPAADSGLVSPDVGKCSRGPSDRGEATTFRANCTKGGRRSSSPIGRGCNPSRHMTPPGSVRERTGSDTYCGAEAA